MSIYLITALNLVNGMCLRASRVVLALFAIHLGAGAFEIGMLIALSSLMQLFLGVYAGQASDRFGFRLPMVYGAIGGSVAMIVPFLFPSLAGLYVSRALTGMTFIFFMVSLQNLAASVLFPLFQHAWILAVVAFLLGLALGCGQPLSMILIYERAPEARTGEALGLRISINKIVQIGVPLLFGYLGTALGLVSVFWTNAALLLGSGYVGRPRPAPEAEEQSPSRER